MGLLPAGLYGAEYLRTIGIGDDVRCAEGQGIPVVVRDVPGGGARDAALPWPYSMVGGTDDLRRVGEACRDLVSVVGVVMTASDRPDFPRRAWVRPHRDQYVLDPALPVRGRSARTRAHVRAGTPVWQVRDVTGRPGAAAGVERVYRDVVRRHGAHGTWLDFGSEHFDRLVTAAGIRTWVAEDDAGTWGAFCTAAADDTAIAMVHLGGTDAGLRRDAMYALMAHLQELALATGRPLYLGNVRSHAVGLARFKTRWSNRRRPAWTVGLVTDREAYAGLPHLGEDYFPAYRRPWGARPPAP